MKDLSQADVAAGKISQGQLAANIYGDARKLNSVSHYVEIDVSGLEVEEPRPGTFLIKNETDLDVTNRIVSHGKVCN
jgi:hypothetical protein